MSKDERDGESHHATSGLAWLAAAVAAVVLIRPIVPWQGGRSLESDSRPYRHFEVHQADARLWQDPFDAIRRARSEVENREKSPAGGEGKAETASPALQATASWCKALITNAKPLLLGVTIAGGPYPADRDARRRARYAVLAALNAVGYVPHDPEHISYFQPSPSNDGPGWPKFIAFESFTPPAGSSETEKGGKNEALVVWLDDQVTRTNLSERARDLPALIKSHACPLGGAGKEDASRSPKHPNEPQHAVPKVVILGPLVSAGMQGLQPDSGVGHDNRTGVKPIFLAYGVSARNERFESNGPGKASSGSKPPGVQVVHTIASDAQVAKALACELKARGIDTADAGCAVPAETCGGQPCPLRWPRSGPRQHVVLISEWDTLDTRALTREVARSLTRPGVELSNKASNIRVFSYLRGLDGHLPKQDKKDDDDRPSTEEKEGPGLRGRFQVSSRNIERSEGQSQYDYLRRLSGRLHALQRELEKLDKCGKSDKQDKCDKSSKQGGIGAIGVLGSDVHDKLLILQALRAQFPGVVFFTTDLDARLLHPRERDWTRNLIVASSFGLELHPDLQRGIAPFRDSYQTSLFLSALAALGNGGHGVQALTPAQTSQAAFDQVLLPVRIFEIGRTRALDLSAAHAQTGSSIHPVPPDLYRIPPADSLRTISLLLLIGLSVWALARGWPHALAASIGKRRTRAARTFAWAAVALAIASIGWLALYADHVWGSLANYWTEAGRGEPITLFEGVSLWPSLLLRAIGMVLSVWMLARGWYRLQANLKMIADRLNLSESRDALSQRQIEERGRAPMRWYGRMFVRIFSFRLVEINDRTIDPKIGLTRNAEAFWTKYMLQNRLWSRGVRVLVITVLYFGAAGLLIFSTSGPPSMPFRGAVSQSWQNWIGRPSVFLMLLLIFFVVDATVFCVQFVRELNNKYSSVHGIGRDGTSRRFRNDESQAVIDVSPDSRWPVTALERHGQKLQLESRYVDHWLNMRFVAMRTEVVGSLIWYPYIVIALLLVSRSSMFDRWGAPIVVDVLNGISVLVVTVCAILLRSSAERLRQNSIWRLTNDMIRLRGGDEPQRYKADQIAQLIEKIRSFRRGAFAPYSQQPLVRALLLPLSGLGGTAVLEMMIAADL